MGRLVCGQRVMIGELVGNYKVVRKIGDGGMGTVYEGVHATIGRVVAIKVLRPQYSKNENIVTRFFNEARAVNIVKHPGIVGSFDYGQLPDGTAYIVMEYCDGESLSDRINRLQAPMGAEALRIGRQIATALAAAHAKGIIHRDLKPDNVIIVPDSEASGGERAKVLDFGIAKIIGDQAPDGSSKGLTKMGALMGTPRYMSPEQCKGSNTVDGKADVYALGVLLFVMLTGRALFEAEGNGGMMAMHLFEPPPSLCQIEPSVSPVAEELVLHMLAKDPKARPAMVEVVTRLEQIGVYATSALPVVMAGALSSSGLRPVQAGLPADASGPHRQSGPALTPLALSQEPTRINTDPPPAVTKKKQRFLPWVVAFVVLLGMMSGIVIYVVFNRAALQLWIAKRQTPPKAQPQPSSMEVQTPQPPTTVVTDLAADPGAKPTPPTESPEPESPEPNSPEPNSGKQLDSASPKPAAQPVPKKKPKKAKAFSFEPVH